jgi:hypothetical protein
LVRDIQSTPKQPLSPKGKFYQKQGICPWDGIDMAWMATVGLSLKEGTGLVFYSTNLEKTLSFII